MNIMEPSVYQQRSKRAVCYKGYSRESVEKSTKEVFFAQRCRSRSEIGGQAVVGGLKIGGGGRTSGENWNLGFQSCPFTSQFSYFMNIFFVHMLKIQLLQNVCQKKLGSKIYFETGGGKGHVLTCHGSYYAPAFMHRERVTLQTRNPLWSKIILSVL